MYRTELLKNVQVCIQKACRARSAQEQAQLLHLAKFWKRLATRTEQHTPAENNPPRPQIHGATRVLQRTPAS